MSTQVKSNIDDSKKKKTVFYKTKTFWTLLGGIVLNFIVFYHQIILSWIGDIVSSGLILISENFRGFYYEGLAKSIYSSQSTIGTVFILGICILIYVAMIFYSLTSIQISKIEVKHFISNKRKQRNRKKDINEKTKVKFFFYILLSLFISMLVVIIIDSIKSTQKSDLEQYQRKIILLRPYTDPKTIDTYNVRWIQMESKSDYDSLIADIDKAIEDHKANLSKEHYELLQNEKENDLNSQGYTRKYRLDSLKSDRGK